MRANEKNLAKNTLFLYLMRISRYVFPLLTFPYLTRVLGMERYGVVVFSNAVMQYFAMITEFGFLFSATNECSQYRHDKERLWIITMSVLSSKIMLVVVCAGVLSFLCMFHEAFKPHSLFFIYSFIGVVLSTLLPDFLFRGTENMKILAYRVLLSKAAYTVAVLVLVRDAGDYLYVPLAAVAGNLVSVVLTWAEIYRRRYLQRAVVSFRDIFQRLAASSAFFLSRVSVSFYTTLNTVVLGLNCSGAAVGQYGVANTLASTCRSFISPVSDAIYPYMVKNKNYRLVGRILWTLEPVVIAGCVILWFCAESTIRIACGEGYAEAVPILRAMLPLIAISLPTYLLGYPVLGAMGRIQLANTSVMVGAAFHVLGLVSLLVLGVLGFTSVALLTFATEAVVLGIRGMAVLKWRRRIRNEYTS